MAGILAHRGPDDEGVWHDSMAGLASRRLKVIDLVGGHQPMSNEDRSCWLAFNGEIYNHRELRRELESKGHRFASRCDGEVIVHLYEEEGESCLERLEGMFALALWDRQEQQLLLARDPLGIKPLYYREEGDRLWFASEAKALHLDPSYRHELDRAALAAYLTLLYIPAPQTAFQGIRKLCPGEALTFRKGRARLHRYWRPPVPDQWISDPREAEGRVMQALAESVDRHLLSDVPLGVFLSSGLDSSSIVALMRRSSSGLIRTFTLDFEEASFGEAAGAGAVARHFGTEHHVFTVKPDVAAALPKLAWHLDEPLADSSLVITHLISSLARERVTVALSGIGGDELFIGYPRYLGMRLGTTYDKIIHRSLRGWLGKLSSQLPDSTRSDNPTGRLRRFLASGSLEPAERYLAWISFSTAIELRELIPDLPDGLDPLAGHRDRLLANLPADRSGPEAVAAASLLDLVTYLPDDLLMIGDKMSMASSLELRVPFCDKRLAETVLSIDPRLRSSPFRLKPLLKRVMSSILPSELMTRPKRGFSVPLGTWLRGPLAELVEDTLSESRLRRRGLIDPRPVVSLLAQHRSGRRDHADRLFALLMLELWFEAYSARRPRWNEIPGVQSRLTSHS
jgi:asparagine synthase (glutamine-hydrolysing)